MHKIIVIINKQKIDNDIINIVSIRTLFCVSACMKRRAVHIHQSYLCLAHSTVTTDRSRELYVKNSTSKRQRSSSNDPTTPHRLHTQILYCMLKYSGVQYRFQHSSSTWNSTKLTHQTEKILILQKVFLFFKNMSVFRQKILKN